MKKMPILVISSFLLLGTVVSCGGPSESSSEILTVNSVTINKSGILTTVYGGSSVSLKATVDGPKNAAVVWTSSSDSVATVSNKGVVKFTAVKEETKVTITATSKDDSTKSDSVEFTVKYSPVNLKNSRGIQDASDIETDGITTMVGDTALMFEDVYDTKWYVESTFMINELSETDNFPKIGLMSINNETGYWNETNESKTTKNAFYYIDAMKSNEASGWSGLNFVTQNDELTDWNWAGQTGYFSVDSNDVAKVGDLFTLGLLRDGIDYYLFAKKGDGVSCYKHVVYDGIAADEKSYALLGGWNVGFTAFTFKTATGEAVDSMFEQPTDITVNASEEYVYIGDTLQLNVTADKILTRVTYSSNNPDIATVDAKGLIVTKAIGDATITVTAGSVTKDVLIHVTDDIKAKVDLDGKMDDLIYTDAVKTNRFRLSKNATQYIDFYTSRNSLGVYFYADYYTDTIKTHETEWWNNDNWELRFGSETNPYVDKQMYISTINNASQKSNFDKRYIGDFSVDAATGLNNIKFEVFVPYATIAAIDPTITKDSIIYVSLGYAPAAGWIAGPGFDNNNKYAHIAITEDGFARYVNQELTTCTENHKYGDYTVTKPASCTEDGTKERVCSFCGHVDAETITAKGEHTFDMSTATVTTPSTCTTHGKGTAKCTTCGNTYDNADLPLDPTNHNGHDFSTGRCECGELVDPANPIINESKKSSGGWDNRSYWTDLGTNIEGNFTLTAKYSFNGNLTSSEFSLDTVWQHPILVVSNSINKGSQGYGDNATFRLDWHGWMDDRDGDGIKLADSQNIGGMYVNDFLQDEKEVIFGSEVTLVAKRFGDDLTLTYTICPKSNDKVYTLTQSLTNIHTTTLDISLSAEFSTFIVTSALLVK